MATHAYLTDRQRSHRRINRIIEMVIGIILHDRWESNVRDVLIQH